MTSEDDGVTVGESSGGPIDEGEFADRYRVAFLETNARTGAPVWVDVEFNGATEPAPLLPEAGAIRRMDASPSRRWLAVQGGSDPAVQLWIVDTIASPDAWAHPVTIGDAQMTVFFPAEDGLAYLGQSAGSRLVYTHELGDDVGAPRVVSPAGASVVSLSIADDQLVFVTDAGEIHAAQVAASRSEHIASVGEEASTIVQASLAADGTAVYARDLSMRWWIAEADPVAPPVLAPIELPPEPDDVFRTAELAASRNRIYVVDVDSDGEYPEPLSYVALDGAEVSAAVTVAIPSGPDGAHVLADDDRIAGGGLRMYFRGTMKDGNLAAYALDTSDPEAPTIDALSGDESVSAILLAHDEQRLYYATADLRLKMVPPFGGDVVDVAPALSQAGGMAGVTLVESEDGRAVFFLGRANVGDELRLWRVGIVDGTPTAPIAMSEASIGITQSFAAPDGGAVAFIADGEVWCSIYADGVPAWFRVSSPGLLADIRALPIFLAPP